MQTVDQDAIQYLRLNELRDNINRYLFPYLTTVTPYFRIVSWLTWIYTRLEDELSSTEDMTISEYRIKSLRYYGIFAVAHVLYGQTTGEPFRGPVGVQTIEEGLSRLKGKRIDFNLPRFGKPANPEAIYKSSLISMKLLEERQQPISSRRYQPILIPTKHGRKLAGTFESQWSKLIEPDSLTRRTYSGWVRSGLFLLCFGTMILFLDLSQRVILGVYLSTVRVTITFFVSSSEHIHHSTVVCVITTTSLTNRQYSLLTRLHGSGDK